MTEGRGTIQHSLRTFETGERKVGGVRLPYLPGLDGLRALAVIAVLLYHAELRWIPGGFLGVEVFFVISGYLITALLLAEHRQRGRVDLKAFWLRRARRLLPALYLLLVVTLAFAVVFLPEEVARLRNDAAAAFAYVTNWYLVVNNESYFETVGRPSLLLHLWSLAVEEQFYVLWPPLFVVGIMLLRRYTLLVALAGAAGSALLMATLYQPDVDPSRIYYGTDTRATGLLLGAALAFVWAPRRGTDLTLMRRFAAARRRRLRHTGRQRQFRARWGWTGPLLLDVVGLAALSGLVSFCILLDQYQPFLYQGGLALVALATVVVIMVTVHPHTRLGAGLLGRWPLRWIGLRSYGIYLWHWPVFMVTRPELDVLITGTPLLILRLAATLVLADLSYRFVETPIRRGVLGRAWKALREARGARRWWLGAGWAGAVGAGAASCVVLGVALAYAQPPAPPSYLSVESIHTEASAPTRDTRDLGATSETETPETGTAASTTSETDTVGLTTAPETAAERAPASRVTAIGDSVMIGAAGELEQTIDNLSIEADVGLQAPAAIDILRKRRDAKQLGEVVIVHIGSNGAFSEEQFEEMMEVLADVHRVMFVNVKVPRPWEQPNNAVLADGVKQYSNAVLVDWYVASVGRPELLVKDGIHLQHEGQRVYTDLIAAYLEPP
jgi:peptidoglycan/LPS O-acetylase OafA/YrhL/lysophospholipase L1-like esterase